MPTAFSSHAMRDAAYWAAWFASDWRGEAPVRIHSSEIGGDGAPRWHPDFERWLTSDRFTRPRPHSHQTLRTTKVMRRLRHSSPRAYEVLYRILVLGEHLEDTTRWLNERATRNNIPHPDHRPEGPHYTRKDCLAIFIAGIDYAKEWY